MSNPDHQKTSKIRDTKFNVNFSPFTMSKDSSPNHIHFHQPRLADVFEEFNRPHTSMNSSNNNNNPSSTSADATQPHNANANATAAAAAAGTSSTAVPSFLPIEDIDVAPQYQPVNPEDEDDVVPDQHAAFGITRVMDARRQAVWRDLGLEELMRGVRLNVEGDGGRRPGMGAGRGAQWGRLGRRVTCLR